MKGKQKGKMWWRPVAYKALDRQRRKLEGGPALRYKERKGGSDWPAACGRQRRVAASAAWARCHPT
jgi:hypothetical protein